MARVPITVMGFRCERCNHEWIPRTEADQGPRTCPKCKSPYWNKPRKNAPPMTYEAFRDRIAATLEAAPPEGLTWTHIRTDAKLPQAYPNNRWVRRMEADIGLLREKDGHGILHWKLPTTPERDRGQTENDDSSKRSRPRSDAKQGRLE